MDIYGYLIIFLCTMATIEICAWNMRALASAGPYISEITQTADVISLSEHRLYSSQLYKLDCFLPGFSCHAKASEDLRDSDCDNKPGHCGLLIAWKKYLDTKVKIIKANSDRICAIKMSNIGVDGGNMYVIGVYMPHTQCQIADFGDHLS